MISDGIPSADARSIVEILNGLYEDNKKLIIRNAVCMNVQKGV